MTLLSDVGLYVHIPFCHRRCHFCAFYLEIARADRLATFYNALLQEIEILRSQGLLSDRSLQSIYFGGGTPTSLPTTQLASLVDLIRTTWKVNPSVEITVEAHPSSVTVKNLITLVEAGFNRISFGAESMNDHDFASIGRVGTVQDTHSAVRAAQKAGFSNVNLDLMYGLPGQSLADWRQTLEVLLTLEPEHVSCYALTLEEGTKLARDVARDPRLMPDELLQVEMDSVAESILTTAGFVRYEISNYAQPDRVCRHNLLYWTDGDYLGLGPSAQSYVNATRFGNMADLDTYVKRLGQQQLSRTEETKLSPLARQRDALVFGLRLVEGVPITTIAAAGRQDLVDALATQGLLNMNDERVWLTPLGRRYADTVAEKLF